MTQAKAETVVAAVVAAGFNARAFTSDGTNWFVRVNSNAFNISAAVADNFAVANAINANMAEVELS